MDIKQTNNLPDSDPKHHALNISVALRDLAEHARADAEKVSDKRAKVLFETSAEVLLGLAKAHDDFASESEPAMTA